MLERFVLRRLAAHSMMEVLLHLDECAACRRVVEEEYEYVAVMREALRMSDDLGRG